MIGNEGKRSPIAAYILKMMGLHPKASDLFISYPSNGYHGFYLEIKRDGYNFPKSDAAHVAGQQAFLASKRALGYQGMMCVGVDECIKAIKDYLR